MNTRIAFQSKINKSDKIPTRGEYWFIRKEFEGEGTLVHMHEPCVRIEGLLNALEGIDNNTLVGYHGANNPHRSYTMAIYIFAGLYELVFLDEV